MQHFRMAVLLVFFFLWTSNAFATDYLTNTPLTATLNNSTTVEFTFSSTDVIPAGSTVAVEFTSDSNTDPGDNRQGIFCDNGIGTWGGVASQGDTTNTNLDPGTKTQNIDHCNFDGLAVNTLKICSGDAWNSYCKSYFYNDTTVISALKLIVTSPPVVTTNAASALSATGATLNGTVNASDQSTVVVFDYGLTTGYGTTVAADQSPVTGTSNTSVSFSLTGLTPGTTYHYRVRGTNATTASGADQTFTTTSVAPTITTTAASAITATTATGGGNVTADGGASVTARGVCWSTSANPTTADSTTSDGTGTGTFASVLTGLTPITTYHVRAYAVNSQGTAYGSELSFTTLAVPPTVTTTTLSAITTTSASSGGNVSDDGGAAVTARGICWSTSADPTTADSYTSDGIGTGAFTSSITGLTPNTTYHVRAYSTNSEDTVYGSDMTFTTLDTKVCFPLRNTLGRIYLYCI